LKIQSICKRVDLYLHAYKSQFKKEIVSISKQFKLQHPEHEKGQTSKYFLHDVHTELEKCSKYMMKMCDQRLRSTSSQWSTSTRKIKELL
jgi:hypothetical protein